MIFKIKAVTSLVRLFSLDPRLAIIENTIPKMFDAIAKHLRKKKRIFIVK